MREAFVVDALRTPIGRRGGALAGLHPVDLAALVLDAVVRRNGLDPALVEDVIMGCVSQVDEQAMNIGRNAVLAAGFPDTVPATTVDRQCGSSQQAIHFAAQGILAGAYDVVIAAGVESMSRVPMGSSFPPGCDPYGPAVHARYPALVPQGLSAELVAEQWSLSREDLDCYALESHRRAACAADAGAFDAEIVPVALGGTVVIADEGIRRDTSAEHLAALKPAFKPDGVITAGNSSQISDGAAAVLLVSDTAATRLGLRARARVHAFAVAAGDPVSMLTATIPATVSVLARAGLALHDVDRVEVSEAFAAPVLAWARDTGADLTKVNVHGGAISLGHPLGGSGARLMTTLVHELARSGGRFGLQTMCEGGGMANAIVVERLG